VPSAPPNGRTNGGFSVLATRGRWDIRLFVLRVYEDS
jgi:hypothetical protein